jgi:hypothetical protein
MIDWSEVTGSERVVAAAYNAAEEIIYVRYPDGVEWWYAACPPHVWEEFIAPATSKGRFIYQILNGHPNGRLG